MSGTINTSTVVTTATTNATVNPTSHVFAGYSTAGALKKKNTSLYDINLINQDLAYAFGTRVGERVMRPNWGCKIWDYFMEQLTPTIVNDITTEATRICNLDSRVSVLSVNVTQVTNGVQVNITLNYQPWNVIGTFTQDFINAETSYFGNTGS